MTDSSFLRTRNLSALKSCWTLMICLVAVPAMPVTAQESSAPKAKASLTEQLAKATSRATRQTYDLKYKFEKGMKFYWEVEHVVRTETSLQGKTEISRSHSLATKCWEVMDMSKDGTATLIYCLTNVDMRHQVTDQPEAHYNSRTDKRAPQEYQHIAESLGLSLATIDLKRTGEVLRKQTNYRDVDLGMGDFTIKLPEKPVSIGHEWSDRGEIIARTTDGGKKRILTRKVYRLTSVRHDIAEISMRTEVLTPIHDPDIESQIVAKITEGTVRFDIEEGLVKGREIQWDKQVQGFRVPDSLMLYQARLSESYSRENPDSKYESIHQAASATPQIKAPSDGPILRR